jgi:glycosyltransferase involved in cell wall biosynthesis
MLEKFGLSLSQTNKYDVNIIGFAAKNIKKIENVKFYPIFRFNRISIGRLLAPFRLFIYLFKVKPSIIIFNTPEILYVIIFYKILTRCIVIYDIQENYFRNIVFNRNYGFVTRILLGYLIRLKELTGIPMIDHAILAEEGYRIEMPYWCPKATVIKNTYREIEALDPQYLDSQNFKSKIQQLDNSGSKRSQLDVSENVIQFPEPIDKDYMHLEEVEIDSQRLENYDKKNHSTKDKITIIYTGTISENYGIFKVVDFIHTFHKKYQSISLVIIGYSANQNVLKRLKALVEGKEYIKLIGGDHLVPHDDIIRYIRNADFGIIRYEVNPSTENCFPTKIYEYMANKLPILIQNYKPWSSFCVEHDSAIEVNFDQIDYTGLFEAMGKRTFYKDGIPGEIYWQEDEKKLLKLMDDIQS